MQTRMQVAGVSDLSDGTVLGWDSVELGVGDAQKGGEVELLMEKEEEEEVVVLVMAGGRKD